MCAGSPATGELGFQLTVSMPDAADDAPATDRQKEAVRLFYNYDVPDISADQAHALLAAREFGRLCCEAIFNRYPERVRRTLAPCLAAYVTSDPEMLRFVTKWSDRNFERGTGSPRVRGTPYFADVEQFASYIEGCMAMNGWTLARLKAVAR